MFFDLKGQDGFVKQKGFTFLPIGRHVAENDLNPERVKVI